MLKKKLIGFYRRITQSIAFVPAIITFIMMVLAFVVINIDEADGIDALLDKYPWLEMRSADMASKILTTLLAGTVSLTVFSFSMVMVVLNQTAVNFSPKILNQITGDRKNQITLGFYIGSIVYYIILLINFTKDENSLSVPDLTFFVAVIFGIISIVFFVHFIHNISTAIQPKQIISMVHSHTRKELDSLKDTYDKEKAAQTLQWFEEEEEWHTYPAAESGYLQQILHSISDLLDSKRMLLKIHVRIGDYVLRGSPVFSVNRKIDEETLRHIRSTLLYYVDERISDMPFYGFRQLTEIAVKALSPAINAPGTALICIDFLTDLLAEREHISNMVYVCCPTHSARLMLEPVTYAEVLHVSFTPIRQYGKADLSILHRLMDSLIKLSLNDLNERKYRDDYTRHAEAIHATADQNLSIPLDRIYFNHILTEMNGMEGYYELPLLELKTRSELRF